jgi:hypothetical protein
LYFNGQGLLQRMDYSADVVGDVVAGAVSRYCFDHTRSVASSLRPSAGGQRHSEGCSALGSDGRIVTNKYIKLIPNAPNEKSNDRVLSASLHDLYSPTLLSSSVA